MFDAKNNNSSCQFAEEIVSFLYGEMTEKTKQNFELHLPDCHSCNEELAAFGVVRSSISDWKEKEFSNLLMPEIVLPIEQKTFTLVENKTQNRSWFASISEFFTLSPAWMMATTACAALLICIGLVFVAVSSRTNSGEMAKEVNQKTSPTPPVSKENTNSSPTNSVSDTAEKEKPIQSAEPPKELAESGKSTNPIKKPLPVADLKPIQPKAKIIPASTTTTSPVKKNETPKVETNKNKVKQNNNLPNLQNEDEEDDSPRLSDLFDEIGGQ
jgi:hypothetical protein